MCWSRKADEGMGRRRGHSGIRKDGVEDVSRQRRDSERLYVCTCGRSCSSWPHSGSSGIGSESPAGLEYIAVRLERWNP